MDVIKTIDSLSYVESKNQIKNSMILGSFYAILVIFYTEKYNIHIYSEIEGNFQKFDTLLLKD